MMRLGPLPDETGENLATDITIPEQAIKRRAWRPMAVHEQITHSETRPRGPPHGHGNPHHHYYIEGIITRDPILPILLQCKLAHIPFK